MEEGCPGYPGLPDSDQSYMLSKLFLLLISTAATEHDCKHKYSAIDYQNLRKQ